MVMADSMPAGILTQHSSGEEVPIALAEFLGAHWKALRLEDGEPYTKVRERVKARLRDSVKRKKDLPSSVRGRYPRLAFWVWAKAQWKEQLLGLEVPAAPAEPSRAYAVTGRVSVKARKANGTTSQMPAAERIQCLVKIIEQLTGEKAALVEENAKLNAELEKLRPDAALTVRRREQNRANARKPRSKRGENVG